MSFPPPWEFQTPPPLQEPQTPLSSAGTPNFLLTYLEIVSLKTLYKKFMRRIAYYSYLNFTHTDHLLSFLKVDTYFLIITFLIRELPLKTDLLTTNCLCFRVCENMFLFSSFLREIFVRFCRICSWLLFSFNALKMLCFLFLFLFWPTWFKRQNPYHLNDQTVIWNL